MRSMGKKKIKKQSPKATLAEVTREMAKPRIAKSARGAVNVHSGVRRAALTTVKRRTKQATERTVSVPSGTAWAVLSLENLRIVPGHYAATDLGSRILPAASRLPRDHPA